MFTHPAYTSPGIKRWMNRGDLLKPMATAYRPRTDTKHSTYTSSKPIAGPCIQAINIVTLPFSGAPYTTENNNLIGYPHKHNHCVTHTAYDTQERQGHASIAEWMQSVHISHAHQKCSPQTPTVASTPRHHDLTRRIHIDAITSFPLGAGLGTILSYAKCTEAITETDCPGLNPPQPFRKGLRCGTAECRPSTQTS